MADSAPTPEALPLDSIERVTFFKRDEVTSDLICCRIEAAGLSWLFHEEMEGWARLTARLGLLPGFRRDWFEAVSKPAFEPCTILAYERADARDAAEAREE